MSYNNSFEIYSFTQLNEIHKQSIYKLWNAEYPAKLGFKNDDELNDYLINLINPMHFFIVDEKSQIQGWSVIFERDYEKWFAIIINSDYHKIGLGKKMLDRLKIYTNELNGWVIDHQNEVKSNGEFYNSPLNFYLKNNFKKE